MKCVLILKEGYKTTGPSKWAEELFFNLNEREIYAQSINAGSIKLFSNFKLLLKCNTLQSYHIGGFTIFYLLTAKLLRKKIIYTVHGNIKKESTEKRGLKKIFWIPLSRTALLIANTVVYPSFFIKNEVESTFPTKHKSVVIHNGINIPKIYSSNSEVNKVKKILTVTNFNYNEKARGIVPLISALNLLRNDGHKFYLDVVGAGKYLQEYKNKYQSKYINFVGFKSDLSKYFENANLIIHASFLDNLPYAILEGIAYQKIVLGSNIGGIPEILNEQYLFKNDDVSIAKKILKYHNSNPSEYLSNLEKFKWSRVIEEYIKIYDL